MEEKNIKESAGNHGNFSPSQTSASATPLTSKVQQSNHAIPNQSNPDPSSKPQVSFSNENTHQVNASSQTSPHGPTHALQAGTLPSHHPAWPAHSPIPTYPGDHYQSMYPPRYEDEDGQGPFLQGVSLVTLGGALGLTAAAAVRWLNGGEFQLLPPPSLPGESAERQKNYHQSTLQHFKEENSEPDDEEGEEFEDDGEDVNLPRAEMDYDGESEGEEDLITSQAHERLLEHIESISESMKTNVSVQEKILQKLTSQGSSITNQSMNLLRASNTAEKTQSGEEKGDLPGLMRIWSELVEIKAELRYLKQMQSMETKTCADSSQREDDPLANTLGRLNTAIDSIAEFSGHSKTQTQNLKPALQSKDSISPPPQDLQKSKKETEEGGSTLDSTSMGESKTQNTLSLHDAIRDLAQENDAVTLRAGCQLLSLYIINLKGNPKNPRYRKIFTTNESFQKVEALIGGKSLLLAVGFEEKQNCLEWLASDLSPEREGLALAELQKAASALALLKSATPSPDLTDAALAVLSSEPSKVDRSSADSLKKQ